MGTDMGTYKGTDMGTDIGTDMGTDIGTERGTWERHRDRQIYKHGDRHRDIGFIRTLTETERGPGRPKFCLHIFQSTWRLQLSQ